MREQYCDETGFGESGNIFGGMGRWGLAGRVGTGSETEDLKAVLGEVMSTVFLGL